MRFGGHETFAIREGWLHKGLRMLNREPELFCRDDVADHLGVGRNMAKSIRHWLQATQLAEVARGSALVGKQPLLQMTELGRTIWERDPYFLSEGTLWILHVNLVNNPTFAASWAWFFNSFGHDRFDRAVCFESLKRQIEMTTQKPPNPTTLERDLGCLLACYARIIPSVNDDPEDGSDCPLRELGLVSFFKTSGYYQLHHEVKPIPPEVLGYAIAKSFDHTAGSVRSADISVTDAARKAGGPGRCFVLTAESLFEVASRAESLSHDGAIEISGMAGDRVIRVRQQSPLDWVMAHFDSITEDQLNVA